MPKNPVNIAKYFSFVIFSVFKKIFNQIIVNIGAELIIKVTRPEEINFSAYTNDQLTKKIDVNPVREALLTRVMSYFSSLKIKR